MVKRIFSPCGQKFEDKHGYIFENGKKEFKVIGKSDIIQRIRSAGLGTTLYEMIEKYQKTGDYSFLSAKSNAFNADLSNMPKNLMELYNLKSTCAEDFKKFPLDFRAIFNHNVDDYFNSIQDDSIKSKIASYLESKGIKEEAPLQGDKEGVNE